MANYFVVLVRLFIVLQLPGLPVYQLGKSRKNTKVTSYKFQVLGKGTKLKERCKIKRQVIGL
jgi:hypothetical protein